MSSGSMMQTETEARLEELQSKSIDVSRLVRVHYQMQCGWWVSDCEDLSYGIFCHSDISAAPIWNHAAWLHGTTQQFKDFIVETRSREESCGRRPTIYRITPNELDEELNQVLSEADYEAFDREVWMVFRGGDLSESADETSIRIAPVRTEAEREDFVRVLYDAFQIKEPGYAELIKRQQEKAGSGVDVTHYIAYAGNDAVCVASVVSLGEYSCLYNVGTSPGARNRGFAGKLVRWIALNESHQDSRSLFLQVTERGNAERLYRRLGFAPAFSRTGYRLRNWNRNSQEFTSRRLDGQLKEGFRSKAEAVEYRRLEVTASYELSNTIQKIQDHAGASKESVFLGIWSQFLSRFLNEESVTFRISMPERGVRMRTCSIDVPAEREIGSWLQSLDDCWKSSSALEGSNDFEATGEAAILWKSLFVIAKLSPELKDFDSDAVPLIIHPIADNGSALELFYHPVHVDAAFASRVADYVLFLTQNMALRPDGLTSELELVPVHEKQKLLVNWSSQSAAPENGDCLAALFERQSAKTPEAPALIFVSGRSEAGDLDQISYQKLNLRVNQLARYLRDNGVQRGVFVGLFLNRSIDLPIAILAIFKAGGVLVPLDPASPTDRLTYIIQDAQIPVTLTSRTLADKLPAAATRIICLDEIHEAVGKQDDSNLESVSTKNDIAYVIYTSGSTGNPKGVLISNGAIANHCVDMVAHYEITPSDRILQFSSFSFDAALEQLFPGLIAGATVCVRGDEVWNPKEFAHYLCELGLTVVDVPTAYWHQLAQEWAIQQGALPPHRLRLVIVGGETMLPETIRIWQQTPMRTARLINAYGPTETTITATAYEVSPMAGIHESSRVPIGRPRGGRMVYILDRFKQLSPIGGIGELYIGGELLAEGYLDRPELTRDRFIPDPFADRPEARLYKTGDLVRFRNDGNIEFLGRADDQVKIRGFRVELGEIETVLSAHKSIQQAAILAVPGHNGTKELVAYFVPRQGQSWTAKDLRFFLRQSLPDYMIPSHFVALETIPLTVNGKVDRKALPLPKSEAEPFSEVFKGPKDPLELRLQLLFEKILNRRSIAVDVSFFELGGDSLQALEVIVGVERITGKNLPLESLYQASTIEGLANTLRHHTESQEWSSLVPLQVGGTRPPLFLIHTTPGDILGYGNLVYHLDNDQPCYGLQSLGLGYPEKAHQSIEEMAEYYIEQMRKFQAQGPYYLGGWCYGGIVALEMAQQLRRAGEQVALLALLETLAPAPSLTFPQYYLRRFQCFLQMGPKRWLRYGREKIRYYRQAREANKTRFRPAAFMEEAGTSSNGADRTRLAQLELIYNTNLRALDRYKSVPYPGRVTLFNAKEIDPALIPDPYYGWRGLASEIEIYEVPGTHDSMLAEPHVSSLAGELDQCLKRLHKLSKESQPKRSSSLDKLHR